VDFLQQHLEAIIFTSTQPVNASDLQTCMNEMFETTIPLEDIEWSLARILVKYEDEKYPFMVYYLGGGYQFLTKPSFQTSIGIHLKQKSKKRISTSSLETLAIIAYKQPITKSQIEQIRGVNCDYAVQKLLEKELIEIKGKAETPGRPVLFGSTNKFMEYFGINSLTELPTIKDIGTANQNQIGQEVT
jgi:segregation and condensation protein B